MKRALTWLIVSVVGATVFGCGLGMAVLSKLYLETLFGIGSVPTRSGFLYGGMFLVAGLTVCVAGMYYVVQSLNEKNPDYEI